MCCFAAVVHVIFSWLKVAPLIQLTSIQRAISWSLWMLTLALYKLLGRKLAIASERKRGKSGSMLKMAWLSTGEWQNPLFLYYSPIHQVMHDWYQWKDRLDSHWHEFIILWNGFIFGNWEVQICKFTVKCIYCHSWIERIKFCDCKYFALVKISFYSNTLWGQIGLTWFLLKIDIGSQDAQLPSRMR